MQCSSPFSSKTESDACYFYLLVKMMHNILAVILTFMSNDQIIHIVVSVSCVETGSALLCVNLVVDAVGATSHSRGWLLVSDHKSFSEHT